MANEKPLKPGDKVKFRPGHPWHGEIGSYIETRSTGLGGDLQIFELIGKAGHTAGARPGQYTRL